MAKKICWSSTQFFHQRGLFHFSTRSGMLGGCWMGEHFHAFCSFFPGNKHCNLWLLEIFSHFLPKIISFSNKERIHWKDFMIHSPDEYLWNAGNSALKLSAILFGELFTIINHTTFLRADNKNSPIKKPTSKNF